ncbi:MAG: efflux RND transporter periplasmic adaptor subunit [Bacteroidia bacterium]|nr:efflux RND transporter periplasmic adaptor subunit [Bacteroidia bacterium]
MKFMTSATKNPTNSVCSVLHGSLSNLLMLALVLGITAGLLTSCGEEKAQDPAGRLKELQAEQARIGAEIQKLQKELSQSGSKTKDNTAANTKTKVVQALTLEEGPFRTWVEVQGTVDARQSIEVTAESMGVVRNIKVKEGQKVTKGQILAELDQTVLLQSIEEIKGQLDFAKQLYTKQSNLWKQNIGSEVQYLNAKNQKESLERRLSTIESQLDMTRIKAPVSGTVDQVYLKLGQSTAMGMPAVRVVNFNDLRVITDLSESYVSRVREGATVDLEFKDLNLSAQGRIAYVARSISALNRTFRAEVPLNNREGLYRPNMIVGMKINDYSTNKAIKIPVNLLQNSDEGTFVMVVRGEGTNLKASRVSVTPGRSNGIETEILQGLQAGDRIITTGYNDLNDGQAITLP